MTGGPGDNDGSGSFGDDPGSSGADIMGSVLRNVARLPDVAPPIAGRAGALGPGDIVAGRYELLQLAGNGGMGTVFRAHDRRTGEPVALKVLRRAGDAYASRFRREAEVLAALGHDAIVRYVDHGEADSGALYLVMDWLTGETLADRLRRGRLSVKETVEILGCVASALADAHARGVVHRDIKPSNLFLRGGSTGAATVLDFGVALLRDADERLTKTGVKPGTPAYMAPEQVRGERDLDARADVFALGCVAFECLAGVHPFAPKPADPRAGAIANTVALGVMAVSAKILFEDPPRLAEVSDGVPPGLAALVASMLAKDRAARPADAAAVARALADVER